MNFVQKLQFSLEHRLTRCEDSTVLFKFGKEVYKILQNLEIAFHL